MEYCWLYLQNKYTCIFSQKNYYNSTKTEKNSILSVPRFAHPKQTNTDLIGFLFDTAIYFICNGTVMHQNVVIKHRYTIIQPIILGL